MELNGVYIAAAVGFTIPTVYLIKQAGITEKLPKIEDDNNILTFSALVIACPFIFSVIYTYIKENDSLFLGEELKYTTPLLTFLLGQFLAKRDKEKNAQKLVARLAKKVDFGLEEISILLRELEGEVLELKRTLDFTLLDSKSRELIEYLNKTYDQTKAEENIYDFQYGQEVLFHMDHLKKELIYLTSLSTESPATIFDWLEEIRVLYISTFKIRLMISKSILADGTRVNFLLSIIKRYQINLERQRDRIEKKKLRADQNLGKGISTREYEEDIDVKYDVDNEASALRQIQELLQEFDKGLD